MSPDARAAPTDPTPRAGALVLVVGPSGAGKDTVLRLAQARLDGNPDVVFVRRVVTRPAGDHEDHETCSEEAFSRAIAAGAFCLWWRAHGLGYGLPAQSIADVAAGHIVVANASRTVVEAARREVPRTHVVLVTAPREVLAARVSARGREADEAVAARIDRLAGTFGAADADLVITNTGPPADAGARLAAYLASLA